MRNLYLMSAALFCWCFASFAQKPISADQMPRQWQFTEMFDQTIPTSDTWWRDFNDSVLDSLISLGVDNNYDLLAAAHRIEMASQSLRQSRSLYFPSVNASAGWSASRSSGLSGKHAADAISTRCFDLGINMNWQVDIFGKVAAKAKQAKAACNASRMEYAGMMVTVCAKIAVAYLQLRTQQAEMQVLETHIAQQRKVADITAARHEAGLASMLDVTQALTTFYSTEAAITSLNTGINTTVNAIAVLIGVFPDQIRDMLLKPAPMPDCYHRVNVGVPMQLLRRRPDIAQAEYELAGYAAAMGVAKKDFLPVLSLSGSVSTAARNADELFSNASFGYNIAPTLSWTVFDGLYRNAALESAKQQLLYGIDSYNNTLLTAVQEVDNAMTTFYNDVKYIDTIRHVVDEARKSFDLSLDLYKQGLTDFINVSNSQINYLTYSNELVEAQGQALYALVNLYQALGGGWSNP